MKNSTETNTLTEIGLDLIKGFSAKPKNISSKYFYDDEGSKIFQEIMKMPEYYLTNAEQEIFETQSGAIVTKLQNLKDHLVIEMGAGDGSKTFYLLRELLNQKNNTKYIPVDISRKALENLTSSINSKLPDLLIEPIHGDYFSIQTQLDFCHGESLFLYLGSNIGNYENQNLKDLLDLFYGLMKKGDKILIGFDLQKNPYKILDAYNDKAGLTKKFNLNLLHRLNRELGGNIDVGKFDFYPFYNPYLGELRSCLISLEKQEIYFDLLEKSFVLEKNELIFTELSKKYSIEGIESLAHSHNFKIIDHFTDSKGFFIDSLWQKV